MQLSLFARKILLSENIEDKLAKFDQPFEDDERGESFSIREPARPINLQFAPRRQAALMPKFGALADPYKRGVAHHIMANHELQALEVMAHVLLKFPEADPEFRKGLAHVMFDEQRHTRMHIERAKKLGVTFGELKVNCYIWKKSLEFMSVLDYLAGLPLVFEGANLDHSLEFAEAFSAVGDERSAALMRVIHEDEIEHVKFGLTWLNKLKDPEMSEFEAFAAHLHYPLRPEKARGTVFQREARLKAGMSAEMLQLLEDSFQAEDS